MSLTASYPTGANRAFGAGVNHPVNPGRANIGSITLGSGLQADSARWDALSPHSVLHMAQTSGTPADTDAAIALGRTSVGNDGKEAAEGMTHMLLRQADRVGTNDNAA